MSEMVLRAGHWTAGCRLYPDFFKGRLAMRPLARRNGALISSSPARALFPHGNRL
jgi:hypothetical protein